MSVFICVTASEEALPTCYLENRATKELYQSFIFLFEALWFMKGASSLSGSRKGTVECPWP